MALKVLSYFTIVIPLVMLCIKAALRCNYSFHIIDVNQKMEEGVDVSEDIIDTIRRHMPQIQARQRDDAITYHSGPHGNIVFSLGSVPGFIFKVIDDADGELADMVKS